MKEDDRFIPFFEAYKDDFFESMEDVRMYLKNSNLEYKNTQQKLHNILDNNTKYSISKSSSYATVELTSKVKFITPFSNIFFKNDYNNNKGQSLVFFILLLPIIFLIIGMLFDLSKVLNEKLKIKHIEEDYIYYLKENTYKEEELDSFLNKNDISSNEVVINSNEICITKKVPSNFGKIINKNTYQIKVCTNKK